MKLSISITGFTLPDGPAGLAEHLSWPGGVVRGAGQVRDTDGGL